MYIDRNFNIKKGLYTNNFIKLMEKIYYNIG